jgi:hypothetical protein
MEYIGKSTKFYTLWEVWEETHHTQRGEAYKVIHHQYIKNISFDIDKAKSKYPNAIVDTSLCGHSSWTSIDYPKPPVDEFQGGKYRGDKIAECTDYQYLHWAYDLGYIIPWEAREIVLGILESRGYRKINDTHIATPEEVEKIEKSYTECEEAQKTLEEFGSIKIVATKNLDEFGNLSIGNIVFNFPNYKELEYGGYPYGLPVDSKGKAKRIKNKEIEIIPESLETVIDEYGWGATLNVEVKDFKIL